MIKKLSRVMIKKVNSLLPKTLRHKMARQLLKLPQSAPRGLTIRPAQNSEEVEKALELVYQSYLKMGYTKEESCKIRLTPHHLVPSTTVIVALINDQIVGTLSMISENALGLPLEKEFSLAHLRANGERLCEVGALAIDPKFRMANGTLMHFMARYAMLYAREALKADYITITVNPAMADLYEAIYLFEPLTLKNKKDTYDYANGKPAVGLFLNLHSQMDRAQKVFNQVPVAERNFFTFMIGKKSWEQFPQNNSIFLPQSLLTPVTMAHLGASRTKLLSNLSASESKAIARSYGQNSLSAYLAHGPSSRKRLLVNTTAIITNKNNSQFTKVYNISSSGLLVRANGNSFSIGDVIKLAVHTGANTIANLEAEVRWTKDQNYLGLQILKASSQWDSLFSSPHSGVKWMKKTMAA